MRLRLPELPSYPTAQELGSLHETIIYTVAKQIGKLCNHLSVNVNFAPCVDINTNPNNVIIGDRSFGTTSEQVINAACAFMRGLQSKNILTCAKHFPGYGDTHIDSHKDLPAITHDINRLREIELAPFETMIQNNVDMIMIGHISAPALDDSSLPASLSQKIITDILRNQMQFSGLIITDALDMRALTNYYSNAESALLALHAGNDLLLYCPDIPSAIERIQQAVLAGLISKQELDEHVMRILEAKQRLIK